jgi:hypothetical protein
MRDGYTVTIYVAAPGTPLDGGGTSAAGHLYYVVKEGQRSDSYGFSPVRSGSISGEGKVSKEDKTLYLDPAYQRTMEISPEQYSKLLAFGEDPELHKFDMQYHGATNSCIDFVWGALNYAGIHRTTGSDIPDRNFDGALKPLDNIEHIRSIPAPIPGSELNTEASNDMPKRTLLQKLISDTQLPDKERGILDTIRAQVAGIDKRFNRTYDETSERISLGLLTLATEKGLDRVDHVLLGNPPPDGSERRMFVVQGEPQNPAHVRASLTASELATTPVERSFEKLDKMLQGQVGAVAVEAEEPKQAVKQTA